MPTDVLPLRASVVIPARNVETTIGQTVREVMAQAAEAPHSIDIVVVDDASTDATADACAEAARGALEVTILRRRVRGGPNASRNAGVAEAASDALVFLDGDDRPGDGWLVAMVEALDNDASIVSGSYILEGVGRVPAGFDDRRPTAFGYAYAFGGAMAVHRRLFERVGGFDENIIRGGTEVEFCIRAQALFGARVVSAPGGEVRHRSVTRHASIVATSFTVQRSLRYVARSLQSQGVPLPGPETEPPRGERWQTAARRQGWSRHMARVVGRNAGRLLPAKPPAVDATARAGIGADPSDVHSVRSEG